MKLKNIVLLLLLVTSTICRGQQVDSIAAADRRDNAVLLPLSATLALAGTLTHAIDGWEVINLETRELVQQWRSEHGPMDGAPLHFDNYLQLAPAAAPWVLKWAGVESRSSYRDLFWIEAEAFLAYNLVVQTVKYTAHVKRPSSWADNSFPSGHTATAFWGAEIARTEFRETAPWVGVCAYAAATLTGFMRIYNDRHWLGDVMAGAAVGIASARFAYWLHPRLMSCFEPQQVVDTSYSYSPSL